MKLVNHDPGVGYHGFHGIPVGLPHIHGHVMHLIEAFKLTQVARHRGLVAVLQDLHDGVVLVAVLLIDVSVSNFRMKVAFFNILSFSELRTG